MLPAYNAGHSQPMTLFMTRISGLALLAAFLCAGQDVLLTVNGQTVVSDKLIDSALAREIARMNGIEPATAELAALRKKWDRAAAAKPAPPAPRQPELDEEGWYQLMRKNGMKEAEAREQAKRQLAEGAAMKKKMDDGWMESMALGFKTNRFLWNKHGGRLVLSAFGFHQATDAFAAEVLELERLGVARFHNTAVREDFYRRMQTYTGDGVTIGERARRILSAPPWE